MIEAGDAVALVTIGAFLGSVGVVLLIRAAIMRRRIEFLQAERFDPAVETLPQVAVPMHLGPELVRSEWHGNPVTVVGLRATGIRTRTMARALRRVVRSDEACYVVGRGRVAVALRDVAAVHTAPAIERFAWCLSLSGARRVDVGIAAFPAHAREAGLLVRISQRAQVPIEHALVELQSGVEVPSFIERGMRSATRGWGGRTAAWLFGIPLASAWLIMATGVSVGLLILAPILVGSSASESRLVVLILALGAVANTVLGGLVRAPAEPTAPLIDRDGVSELRRLGYRHHRAEGVVAVLGGAVLAALAVASLLVQGDSAQLVYSLAVVAAVVVVASGGGRALSGVGIAYPLLGLTALIVVGIEWVAASPSAVGVALVLVGAIATGTMVQRLVRAPSAILAAIVVGSALAGVAVSQLAQVRDLTIRQTLVVGLPDARPVSVGTIIAAAAIGALATRAQLPFVRLAMGMAAGAAAAVYLQSLGNATAVPTSAAMACVAILVSGTALARPGRNNGSARLRQARRNERRPAEPAIDGPSGGGELVP